MGADDAHAQAAPDSAPTRSGAQDSGYGSLQSTAAQQPAHIQSKSLVDAGAIALPTDTLSSLSKPDQGGTCDG